LQIDQETQLMSIQIQSLKRTKMSMTVSRERDDRCLCTFL